MPTDNIKKIMEDIYQGLPNRASAYANMDAANVLTDMADSMPTFGNFFKQLIITNQQLVEANRQLVEQNAAMYKTMQTINNNLVKMYNKIGK